MYTAWVVEWFRDHGIGLPYVVPAHHFLLYVRISQAMLAGVGLAWLVSLACAMSLPHFEHAGTCRPSGPPCWEPPCRPPPSSRLHSSHRSNAGTTFTITPTSLVRNSAPLSCGLYALVRGTPASTVVLTSDRVGGFIIGPAGRKVVAVEPFFSNPYVSHARLEARSAMWRALATGDCEAFDLWLAAE